MPMPMLQRAIAPPTAPSPPGPASDTAAEPAENNLLRQILLGVSKMSKTLKTNDQAIRDITGRLSSIEDRLSLMEQRILRIDTRVVEIIDQERDINGNVKKALFEIGETGVEIKELRGLAHSANNSTVNVEKTMATCLKDVDSIGSDVENVMKLVECLVEKQNAAPETDIGPVEEIQPTQASTEDQPAEAEQDAIVEETKDEETKEEAPAE
ncbi:MAG: hypothetical protein M1829_006517 [Trizodia sp. TS-e1964]|nr:MAG: hypothetical protein M1829_006517 [Trizodia sp. TS-e1964]